jgi:hypothetical protein
MSGAQHTPGLWRVVSDNHAGQQHQMVIDERGFILFDSVNRTGLTESQVADMTLAAAAPALLMALQNMVKQFSKVPSTLADSAARTQAHDAINQAIWGAA